jgi:hypothetical protein
MTIFEFAEGLNGREYGNEITPFEEQRAKNLDSLLFLVIPMIMQNLGVLMMKK